MNEGLKVRRIHYGDDIDLVRRPGEPYMVNGEMMRFDPTGDYIPDEFVDVIQNTGSGLADYNRRRGILSRKTQITSLSVFEKRTRRILENELARRIEEHAKRVKREEGWR